MIRAHLFIVKNRSRKKWLIRKRLFQLSFDLVSLFYTFVLLGYISVAIILDGNITQVFHHAMNQLEAITLERFGQIVTIIPLFYLSRAFQQPGVLFTTSEYLLTILPNRLEKVWIVTAFIRWLRALAVFLIVALTLLLFSPTSGSVIVLYVCLLLCLNILMTIPEWKFFQLSIWRKIAVFLLLIVVNIINFYMSYQLIGVTFILLLIIYNIVSIRKLFTHVDWRKVTIASDFILWNMKIISHATKIKFKKERQYSLWQKLHFWKKPFPYKKRPIYNRLWHLYIEKNTRIILQIIGALSFMLFVFMLLKEVLFLFGVAITIHIYTSLVVSMFQDRLVTDIVEVLPWDVHMFKNTLMKWAYFLSILLFIPYLIYMLWHFTYWHLPQLFVIICTFRYMLQIKLDKIIKTYDKKGETDWSELACYGLLVIILFSNLYPLLLIIGLFIIGIIPFLQKRNVSDKNRDTHLT